jgi:Methyltransferase domain/C-methyltransferase C-terminal domain
MRMQDNFSFDESNSGLLVFRQNKVPVFQNKVYPAEQEALLAEMGEVELIQSNRSGFIFNNAFNPDLMVYDGNYQNEQSNSTVFQDHLRQVLQLLISFGISDKKVVEIGSGKGVFFEMMLEENIDCWGFDPTYEKNNPRIRKEYFGEKHSDIHADVIIMRHTLEHIPRPFSFIHTIAKANNYKGKLFVEVPTFDWIVKKKAFWDIFYEHCNYFTESSIAVMFNESKTGNFFGGQYIYLWADLANLRDSIPQQTGFIQTGSLVFEEILNKYRSFLREKQSVAIWGAGAKGSTFLNILDPERKLVKYVIDINPAKQNKYVAGTAHKINPPDILNREPVDNILVMNENYFAEVKNSIRDFKGDIFNL